LKEPLSKMMKRLRRQLMNGWQFLKTKDGSTRDSTDLLMKGLIPSLKYLKMPNKLLKHYPRVYLLQTCLLPKHLKIVRKSTLPMREKNSRTIKKQWTLLKHGVPFLITRVGSLRVNTKKKVINLNSK
jgi:hypothetical protein